MSQSVTRPDARALSDAPATGRLAPGHSAETVDDLFAPPPRVADEANASLDLLGLCRLRVPAPSTRYVF